MKLIFATSNQHKVDEILRAVGSDLHIISQSEAGINADIPEPFETLKENAREKASTIFHLSGHTNCFSEDTGLEVDSLNGEPGVRSARYAGEPVSYLKNTEKLLLNMNGRENRRARFITVICLILNGAEYFFEGRCEGKILESPRGEAGFGYDPVFIPDGSDKSFAEMSLDEKNKFSHRRKAVDLLIDFLKALKDSSVYAKS